MELVKQLNNIQKHLKVPKNRKNSFGGYYYRNAEDIESAVKKELPDGLSLVIGDKIVNVGSRYYVCATAALISENGERLEAQGWAREPENKKGMDESQITGSTSSYARKYALCGLFAIDDGIDADDEKVSNPQESAPAKSPQTGKITEKQLKRMYAIANKNKVTPDHAKKLVKEIGGVDSAKDLSREAYDKVIERMEAK